ncbi:tetratricopeptide repeat protein [Acidocella sp.]|uniref:tetratricopeptide repeat protein n=1 Tax=Acidocella sp. TaxID=50710 RepID=UPI002F3F3FE7
MNRKQRRAQVKTVSAPQQPASANLKMMFEAGLRHHQVGQLAEAERFYRQVLAIDALHADALHLLGVIANQTGRNDMAVEIIGKAIKINPTAGDYHYNLGTILINLGRLDEAVVAYNNAIRCRPDYAEAHSNLGNALRDLGRLHVAGLVPGKLARGSAAEESGRFSKKAAQKLLLCWA